MKTVAWIGFGRYVRGQVPRRAVSISAALAVLLGVVFLTTATPVARAATCAKTADPSAPSVPAPGQPCWTDVVPYPFGFDGNPVDVSATQCGNPNGRPPLAPPTTCLQVTSFAFRAWNRGLAATVAGSGITCSDLSSASKTQPCVAGGAGAYGVWLFNGTSWFPDPTFPGSAACPGTKVLWAGKLDYWLIGGPTAASQQTLCRFDGVNLAWEPLRIPAATSARLPYNSSGQPLGGIATGACFAWNNCQFFGVDGIQDHWDGQVLSDVSSGSPGTSPWLQGDSTASVAQTDQAGNEFGLAVSASGSTSPGGSAGGQPLPAQPEGAPPPQVFASPSGPFAPLSFVPPSQLEASALANATSGQAPLGVAFTGAATGGTPPYSYSWNFGDGSATSTSQNPSHTYANAGTYTATLTVNDSSSRPETATSSLTITSSSTATTVPGAPTGLTANLVNGQVSLSWTAPSSDGGSAVMSYRVYSGASSGSETLVPGGGCSGLGAVTSCTDTFAGNQVFFYRVSAINSVGEGAQSNETTNQPFTTDLVAVDSDPQGDVWVAGDPTLRDGIGASAQPAPLLRLTKVGASAPCQGYDGSTFSASGRPYPADGSYRWSALSVFPSDGSVLAGAEYLTNDNAEPQFQVSGTIDEPSIVHAACGQAPSATRFRVPDPFYADPTTAPLVPADQGGVATAVAANASNDGWAATTSGSLSQPGPGGTGSLEGTPQPPHLYRFTDGQTPNAPAGDDSELRPSLFTLDAPVFVTAPPTVVVPPPTTTTTTTPANSSHLKLAPAIYSVHTKLLHGPHGTFRLIFQFRVRRPVTIGVQALRKKKVVASSGLRHFTGAHGQLSLTLDRNHWPTKVRFITPKAPKV